MGSLTERTRKIDVLNFFKEKFHKTNLDLQNLISACTFGASSMIEKRERFVAFLQKELPNPDTSMSFYCIFTSAKLIHLIFFAEWYFEKSTKHRKLVLLLKKYSKIFGRSDCTL